MKGNASRRRKRASTDQRVTGSTCSASSVYAGTSFAAMLRGMDNRAKHLELIQGVVNRLSHNSFLLKGWSVVLVSALFALSAADSNLAFIYLAYFPVFVFWGLDGYFLWEEKKFRKLYDRVRQLDEVDIDFSMDTGVVAGEAGAWWDATWSKTLIPLHGAMIGAVTAVMVLTMIVGG